MKKTKVVFLLLMFVASLFAVNIQSAQSQTLGSVYIQPDGTVVSSVNATVPIQQDGDIYTFTDDLELTTFWVYRSHITIDGAGFILQGDGDTGIDLSYASNVTIKNVQLAGMFYTGIYISETSQHTITGCTIANNVNGLGIYSSSQNNITDNNIVDNSIGIDLRDSSDNVFRNNMLDSSYNIALYGSQQAHFVNDMDDSNTIGSNKKVYYLVGESNLDLTLDNFPDVGFLALVSCTNINVYGLTLTNNVEGLLLAYSSGVSIGQCEVSNNYHGVVLFASVNNQIGENTITNNFRGIQLSMSSTGNTIFSNIIASNEGGIFLFDSAQNRITGNNITDNNSYGIGFSSSSSNMLNENYFVNNNYPQIYDSSTSDSTITPSINTWQINTSQGRRGNYWSDYTGVDAKSGVYQNETGSDGIGDTPYIIDANNQDAYPLMPYGSPPAVDITSPQNMTYSVTSVTLTYIVSEEASWVGYSIDGEANVTIDGSTTLADLTSGMHSIIVYVEDTDGVQGASEPVYFTIASGSTSGEPFPTWILVIIIVAVVAVILFFFVRIIRKK